MNNPLADALTHIDAALAALETAQTDQPDDVQLEVCWISLSDIRSVLLRRHQQEPS